MEKRRHPFAPKLTDEQAEEVRRRRRAGASLAELATRFGISKSSVSAVVHLHAHCPPSALRVVLPDFERALLAEYAVDEGRADEDVASELLLAALRRLPP